MKIINRIKAELLFLSILLLSFGKSARTGADSVVVGMAPDPNPLASSVEMIISMIKIIFIWPLLLLGICLYFLSRYFRNKFHREEVERIGRTGKRNLIVGGSFYLILSVISHYSHELIPEGRNEFLENAILASSVIVAAFLFLLILSSISRLFITFKKKK